MGVRALAVRLAGSLVPCNCRLQPVLLFGVYERLLCSMDAPQLIQQWLDSRQDYAQGLALAQAHGVSGHTLTLLQSGQNSYTQGKLRVELQLVLDQLRLQANAPAPAAAAAPADPAAEASPELVALRARRMATFKQAAHHFEQMRAAPEGEPRRLHAVEIKKLWRENTKLWQDENYYLQFGHLPPEQELATLDREDLRAVERRRNTLRTYLSGAKNKTRAKADPSKVATWTAEMNELNLILQHG